MAQQTDQTDHNPKTDPAPNSNPVKDPDNWTTGGEPMTGAQASYLKTLTEQTGEAFDEIVVDPRIDIDTLHPATALTGIVERPVDQILDGMIELGVGAHIGRVLAAEL